jgi:hypothetical protein
MQMKRQQDGKITGKEPRLIQVKIEICTTKNVSVRLYVLLPTQSSEASFSGAG